MPSLARYVEYKIDQSILTIGNITAAVDYNNPLTFKGWLSYFNDISVSSQTYETIYTSYLNEWNNTKNKSLAQQNKLVKQDYVRMSKDLQLDAITEQERTFLRALDYNDDS